MKRLKYKGREPYEDPALRFILQEGDLVDLPEIEAEALLADKKLWKEVASEDGTER